MSELSEREQKRSKFPSIFYIANSMDIFERFAWFGFFAVSGFYMTDAVADGGLGLSHIERGFLQGLMPFLLYLLPVITGAMSDRFGYRKMFILSFIILVPSYYMLGQVTEFWSFALVFLCVAIGAAIYKPLVIATITHVTDKTNRGVGFGFNYMLVNLGATLGILIAGYVREISWDLVFIMSSVWVAINFIPAIFFFKEPTKEASSAEKRSVKQVLLDAQEVLGNGRFALIVVPILFALLLAGGEWISWQTFGIVSALLIVGSFVWDRLVSDVKNAAWYQQRAKIGNWPFVLYLLILAGFWTTYNQLFITMPLYIDDFVDTSDVVAVIAAVSATLANFVSAGNIESLSSQLPQLLDKYGTAVTAVQAGEIQSSLMSAGVRVPIGEITSVFSTLNASQVSTVAETWINNHSQMKPEYLININFMSIVFFQVLVSAFIDKFDVVKVLVAGTLLCTLAWFIGGYGHYIGFAGLFTMLTILIFSFGEMVASPKSTEYVATIAPKNKVAMFMGYYFVCMALGNLFSGILSGWAYEVIAIDMNNPELMWTLFGGLGAVTAVAFVLFNRYVVHHIHEQQRELQNSNLAEEELSAAN